MKNNVSNLVSFFGSIGSIISLFFVDSFQLSLPKIILFIFLIIIVIFSTYFIFVKKENYICKSDTKINQFMEEWISTKGVVKIFSRDLSWVNKKIAVILAEKGEDLFLFVEKENDAVSQILNINEKCNVYYYGEDLKPKSRFTIIHANKEDRQIAIALQELKAPGDKIFHEIYVSKGDTYGKKILGLAEDLLSSIEYVRSRNDKKN